MPEASSRSVAVVRSHAVLVALALAFGLAAAGSLAGAGRAFGVPAPLLADARTLSSTPAAAPSPPIPMAASAGQVLRTLVLFNNTVTPGSFSPTIANNPTGVLYDSIDRTAWVSSGNAVGVLNASTAFGTAWLPSYYTPWGLALDNRSDEIFVADFSSSNASVFNAATHARVGTVSLAMGPFAAAYDWRTDEMYFTNYHSNNVTVVRASTLAKVASVTVGSLPEGVAYVPSTGEIYVANSGSNNVSVIAEATHNVAATIAIPGSGPQAVLFDAGNQLVYVGGLGGVWSVDPATRAVSASPIPMAVQYGLALDPSTGVLYGTDYNAGTVGYASTSSNTVLGHINLGPEAFPTFATYDAVDNLILVSDLNYYDYVASNVSEISASSNTVVGAIGLEHLPSPVLYDTARGSAYVYDGGTGDVYEINDTSGRINRSVFVGYTPHAYVPFGGLAIDPTTDALYADAYNSLTTTVCVVDLTSFHVTKDLPSVDFAQPSGIAFDPTDNRVYVANYGGSNVTVVSAATNTVTTWVATGLHPAVVLFDPANDGVYVTNFGGNTVTVLHGATNAVAASVRVGTDPLGAAVDPVTENIFVVNVNSQNLTAISGVTNRTVANVSLQLSNFPQFLAYDGINDTLLVDAPGTTGTPGQLGIVDASSHAWVGTVSVGTTPVGIAYDVGRRQAIVANEFPGSLSFVAFGTSPLSLTSFTAHPASISLGQSAQFAVLVSGGSPPLTYAYSTLPAGCTNANVSTLSCTPTAAGTFTVGVNVSDTAGGHVSATTRLTVTSVGTPLQLTSFVAGPSPLALGQSATFTATASGGVPPLSYAYASMPPGCASSNASQVPCTPTATGSFSVAVVVNDSAAHSVTGHATLLVYAPLTGASLAATPANLTVGGTTVLGATAAGGLSPFTYVYSQLPTGCTSGNTSQLSCTPSATGVFHPAVRITDSSGKSANATATLTVVASGGPTPSGGNGLLGELWPWVLLVAVVAAALVGFYLYRRRGQKLRLGGETPPPPPERPPGR